MQSNRSRTVGYWVSTGLVALAFAGGAVSDLLQAPEVMASLDRLGYPAYVASLLGIWKALGVIALLVPRYERLKEWAYAGMFFDLTGAAVSHLAAGDPPGAALIPLFILGLVMASWALRPANRRLASPEPSSDDRRVAPNRELAPSA
jgi:hypothetical protein